MTKPNDNQPTLPPLTPNNILGIVQRSMVELNAYMSQPPHMVDRAVCLGAIEDIVKWVGCLPPITAFQPPPNGVKPDAAPSRKN